MNFTHKNHLKYWIGDRLYSTREYVDEPYRVEVGAIDPEYYLTSNWVNEQYRTAQLVHQEFGNDFVVMFSGGTDSEIVIRAFVHNGVTPRCVFIKFKNNYNYNDLVNAMAICHELGIDLEVIEFDVKDFYNSGQASEFAADIQCRQMAYLTVYHHIKKLGLPAVMGGEMLMRRQIYKNKECDWYYTFRENEDASAMRFSLKHNLPLVNEWFSYTPEMIAYHLQHPAVQCLFSEKYNYKLGSVSTKNKILYEYMPELTKKKKTHGYENLIGFNTETYDALQTTHLRRLEGSVDGILIKDMNKMLHGENQ